MAIVSTTFDPSSAHPTGSFQSRILRSDTPTSGSVGFKAGTVYTGSGGDNYVTIVYGQLPTKEDIYGAGVTDSGLTLTNMKLNFNLTTADTDTEYYFIQSIKDGETTNFPTEQNGVPSYGSVDVDLDEDPDSFVRWYNGTNFAQTTIVATGIIDTIHHAYFRPHSTGAYTIDLQNLFKSKSLKWGDKFNFVIRKLGVEDQNEFIEVDTDTTTTNDYMNLLLYYEDPEPTMPVIKLEADTDYRSSIVTMTTKPTDKDIVEFATVWKDNGTDTFENRVGVNYSATNRVQFTGGSQFATGIFKEIDSDIADGFLDTEGETDNIVVWASDMSASGTTTSVVNRTMSNRVAHARMSCTGSLSAGTVIGEELTLTVSGFSDDGDSAAASFKKFGVNWDGDATPANDSIDDYTIITSTQAATTATVKHTFHKAGTYKVNICVIDSKGFRSDFTLAESRAIAQANPVAVLRSSRDTVVRAKYGDEFSVVTLSASHSYPVGSDRMIFAHRFQHNGTAPVTTYPMNNDNSNFNDASQTIKLKCNTGSCAGTTFKVFGKISVTSAGGDIADTHATFDHYEQAVVDMSPGDAAEGFGGASDEYFKNVDFIVCSIRDAQDETAGAVYSLLDADDNIINNKLRIAKNTDAWGGYVARASITCAFHTGNKTITNTGATFLTDGFVPGDTIWVDGAIEDVANNNFFTVTAVTATVITVNESTLVTGDGSDASVTIYKVNGPTLPVASYSDLTPTITLDVRQAGAEPAATHNLNTSTAVTQALRFVNEELDTLDLDTQSDAGHLAIQSAAIKRSGGINSLMALGNKSYPIGTTRTKMGTPSVSLTVRVLTQTGYRQLWNLIEGSKYEWVTIDAKKVDSPSTAYKQLRMRLIDGAINKDPSLASQYIASLNFVVIGELVS